MVLIGLALLAAAVACFVAEANLPSGAFGIAGAAATIIGGYVLVQDARGAQISVGIVLAIALLATTASVYVGVLAVQTRDSPPAVGAAGTLVGAVGVVKDALGQSGHAQLDGARWRVVSSGRLQPGMRVRVVAVDGLTATVEPASLDATGTTT